MYNNLISTFFSKIAKMTKPIQDKKTTAMQQETTIKKLESKK